MKVFGQAFVLFALVGNCFSFSAKSIYKNQPLNSSDPTIEQMKQFDENIELGEPYSTETSFNQPFGSVELAKSGDAYSGITRGATSVNEGESDGYVIYDKKENNNFARIGNFNGTTASRTRISFWYWSLDDSTPFNMPKTDHMNVAFRYRLYASEEDKLSINDSTLVFRYQSRGSADGKSCDVYAGDLIFNEPGDFTWHSYSFRMTTTYSMTTAFGWFFFYYNKSAPSIDPTYYADIDDFYVSRDGDKNYACMDGTFDFVAPPDSNAVGELYSDPLHPNYYYRPEYGLSVYQENNQGNSYLRMNGATNKTTFSHRMNEQITDPQTIYINFDYKNLSYYHDPDLKLMFNGRDGVVYNDIIGKEVNTTNYISYIKDLGNGWYNQSIYVTLSNTNLRSIDFLLEVDCDLAIDNLLMADFYSIDYNAGNYDALVLAFNSFMTEVGEDYQTKYVTQSVRAINSAISAFNKITVYSSQAKMDAVIVLIQSALANLEEKGDLDALYAYIDQIFDEMAGTNKNDYEIRSYIRFKYALDAVYKLTYQSSKEKIDQAFLNLKEAYEGLIRLGE